MVGNFNIEKTRGNEEIADEFIKIIFNEDLSEQEKKKGYNENCPDPRQLIGKIQGLFNKLPSDEKKRFSDEIKEIINRKKNGVDGAKKFEEDLERVLEKLKKVENKGQETQEIHLDDELAKDEKRTVPKTKQELANIELARKATKITLDRINNYTELNAKNEKDGDEKFKEKTRALWKEFVTHGMMIIDKETGEPKLLNRTDLDGKIVLGLLERAGFNIKKAKYVKKGESREGAINIDTGDQHGLVVLDNGKTVFIDHHGEESKKDSSTTKFTYETLLSLELIEKKDYLDKLVEFVTKADNKEYPVNMDIFKKSHKTLVGLERFADFKNLIKFFKDGRDPEEELSKADLRAYHFIYQRKIYDNELEKICVEQNKIEEEIKKMSYRELEKLGMSCDKGTGVLQKNVNRSEEQKESIDSSLVELERMKKEGLIINSKNYGKIAVDINGQVQAGFDATRAVGCGVYVKWMPGTKSFFISSSKPFKEDFELSQGKKVRETMWIKPIDDDAEFSIKLSEVLKKIAGEDFESEKELKKFLDEENGIKDYDELLEKLTDNPGHQKKLKDVFKKVLEEAKNVDASKDSSEGKIEDVLFKKVKEFYDNNIKK